MIRPMMRKLCGGYCHRILRWFDRWLSIVSLVILATIFLSIVDQRLFPIVKDFEITSVTMDSSSVVLYGHMNKIRSCRPLDMSAYYQSEGLAPYAVELWFPENHVTTRPSIFQSWGPWVIEIPEDSKGTITLFVNHRCHPLWDTTTNLVTIPVDTRNSVHGG